MGLPARDVFSMTDSELQSIYRNQYWNAVKGDRLPLGIDFVVFDGSVNSGPRQSVIWLQRALGDVKVDGMIGEATIGAIVAHPNHDALVADICDQRMKFLKALRTWRTFGKGWTRRVDDVKRAGQAWASGEQPATANTLALGLFGMEVAAKAMDTDVKAAPSQVVGAVLAGAGVTIPQVIEIAGRIGAEIPELSGTVNQLKGELILHVGVMPFLQPIIDHLTTVGSVLAVAGLAYAFYAKVKGAVLNDAIGVKPA
jgi:lysozyme family protein